MRGPWKPSRTVVAVVTVPLVTGGVLALGAAPASAATTRCSGWQQHTLPVVGKIAVKTCVQKDGYNHKAWVHVEWFRTYGGTDFDGVKVRVRLERKNSTYKSKTCDYTKVMNQYKLGKRNCTTARVFSTQKGGWTGDGYVDLNFNLDGKGWKRWELKGSPSVS
ncbi:hypothetical protein GCM10009678_37520 [Actinomadura kijaniata]|uniref:Secreted protein n=1 Tax=Actinomadura namibiensis TaxID=182080 RepID=A0A7W3LZI1_ACTNM|nr:hypothetical protein [Actinomadura namibiensis]MBA8957084.1 hypothetical protein [Actinomadura namibiensis]